MLVAPAVQAEELSQDSVSNKVQLNVGGIPTWETSSIALRAYRAVFDRFKELNPDIELVRGSRLRIEGPAEESKTLLEMAEGIAAHILYVNLKSIDNYIQQNFLYPLDEYLQTGEGRAIAKRIHRNIWPVIKRNGHVSAIPFRTQAIALFYRRDLFKEAGLDPNRPPQR